MKLSVLCFILIVLFVPVGAIKEPIPDTLTQLLSHSPDADPLPGVPYVWGLFTVERPQGSIRAWWVSIQGVGQLGDGYPGSLCIDVNGYPAWDCKIIEFYEYIPNIDMNVYYGVYNSQYCNKWMHVASVYLLTYGTWREPNNYFTTCIFLPLQKRG